MQKNKNIRLYPTRYQGCPVYAIKHKPSGWRAYFDRDEAVKQRIQEAMQTHTIYYDRHNDCFMLDRRIYEGEDKGKHTNVSLESFIYECIKGVSGYHVSRRILPNHRKKHIDCRIENLWSDGDIVLDNPSRRIFVTEDGKNIVLYMKAMDVTERMTYTPELFNLITKPANISFMTSGASNRKRVAFKWNDGAQRDSAMLSTLCYAVYKMGVTEENYRQELPRIKRLLGDRKIEIDHINSDCHNHCDWNITPVSSSKNGTKSDLFTRLKLPYFAYCAVTESGEYRIKVGCTIAPRVQSDTMPSRFWENYYICPTVDDLIAFLTQIKGLDRRLWGAKSFEKIRTLWGIDRKGRYAAQDFDRAQVAAEDLLSRAEDDFTVFTADSKLVIRPTFDVA